MVLCTAQQIDSGPAKMATFHLPLCSGLPSVPAIIAIDDCDDDALTFLSVVGESLQHSTVELAQDSANR